MILPVILPVILVDTSVWIDFLRGEDSAERQMLHRFLEEEEDLAITEIILTEILQGISKDEEFEELQDSLLAFPIYRPAGTETYLRAARIFRECRKRGQTVRKTIDCIIAAICLEHDLTLFHKDADFRRIEACTGLKVFEAR